MLYQLTWNNNKRENPMCLTAGFVRVLSGFLQLLPTPNLDKVYIIEFLKHQLHEGELTGWIVDELWIRLIPGEQATFSCPFVTGERSHRNRRHLQRWPMTKWIIFSAVYLNCSCLQNQRVLLDTVIVHLSREQTLVSQGTPVWHHELAWRKSWRCVRLDYRSRVADA